jgi:hypothetical protein
MSFLCCWDALFNVHHGSNMQVTTKRLLSNSKYYVTKFIKLRRQISHTKACAKQAGLQVLKKDIMTSTDSTN